MNAWSPRAALIRVHYCDDISEVEQMGLGTPNTDNVLATSNVTWVLEKLAPSEGPAGRRDAP